jgi:hypothetical protein
MDILDHLTGNEIGYPGILMNIPLSSSILNHLVFLFRGMS